VHHRETPPPEPIAPAAATVTRLAPVPHMEPAEDVTIRRPVSTPPPTPAPSPTPAFERPTQPTQYRRSTPPAGDAQFVRRAALGAAVLGAICGAAAQLLAGG
jgi:hypothetical protein